MKCKQKILSITLTALLMSSLISKTTAQTAVILEWTNPTVEILPDLKSVKKLYFKKAFYNDVNNSVPDFYCSDYFSGKVKSVQVESSNVVTKELTESELKLIKKEQVPSTLTFRPVIKYVGPKSLVQIFGNALINKNGRVSKVISFEYVINPDFSTKRQNRRTGASPGTSALQSGTWYKISVTKTGIHKINKDFFTAIGIDTKSFNPKNIRIYGNGTGMLPESNKTNIAETLDEANIFVYGQDDGVFNNSDYVLFYGVGPHVWDYDTALSFHQHRKHLYSDTAYYFLNIDLGAGKRIDSKGESSASINYNVGTYDSRDFYEADYTNLLKTGKKWVGEYFDLTTSYKHNFSFPGLITSTAVKIKAEYAVRSFVTSGNNLGITVNGSNFQSKNNISAVSSHYTNLYAQKVSVFGTMDVGSSSLDVTSVYSKPQASSVAWLDFITINGSSSLSFSSGQLDFRNYSTVQAGNVSRFNMSSGSDLTIWDVSDPLNVQNQSHAFSAGSASFTVTTETLKEYVAFDGASYFTPGYHGKIANQNITAHVNKAYILICPPEFVALSQELVDFHQAQDNLSGAVITTDQIYNEFSSGAQDVTAIRNYMRYLYNNSSSKPKYLMLVGDGSYDYKYRVSGNTNFVPSYQSDESFHPLTSFTSDDYYGILDDSVSILNNLATLDIGIGRAPVKNTTELKDFIEKVKNYVASAGQNTKESCTTTPSIKNTFGSWKNNIMFVADDGSESDGWSSDHLLQAELIFDQINLIDSSFNQKKVYMDSFEKIPSASGGTYPDVTREINTRMDRGVLIVSYIGHGGEAGWADERVLEIDDVLSWNHSDRLPLFLTATCEFSRFDDPSRIAAGEHVFLNPDGGAIALVTTVRLVFGGISNNIGFAINFFNNALPKKLGNTIGDGLVSTKNESPMGSSYNKRKFVLLGDPAIKLAIPQYNAKTTIILDELGATTDTLKALSKIKVKGEVQNEDGTFASDFNGVIYPTVYDVPKKTFTLDNNNKGRVDSFLIQNNILFKGKATISEGKFEYEFIVPKDISYSYGEGKISYYLANTELEGSGFSTGFRIGGTSSNYAEDNSSPTIELFMNDSNFVNGGLTNESPVLIANINDVSGINTAGAGIGHDITAIIDNNSSNQIVMNEYYEAKIDDYTGGTVTYPLSELTEGPHNITVKAWDIHNNSASQTMDFIVSNSAELALKHVLNYPNPFSTNTDFYFEHNHACSSIQVRIQVFTVSGKLVKTLTQTISGNGNLKGNAINWDGRDDYGDVLGKGVYLYKLKALTSDGLSADKIEKLVILN
jgi:hypothetical protein